MRVLLLTLLLLILICVQVTRMGSRDHCPICLEAITGESYLDQCFHTFCFHCILQWSEMVLARSYSIRPLSLECPLCKTHFISIIHNFIGTSFQRYYVINEKNSFSGRSFKSEAHMRRLAIYYGSADSRGFEENMSSSNTLSMDDMKSGKKAIQYSASNRWLRCWVRRELQALMQEEDVDVLVLHVVGIVESFQGRKGEAVASSNIAPKSPRWISAVSKAVQPYIFEHSNKFAVEIEKFLSSGLDIAAYDQFTTFQPSELASSSEVVSAGATGPVRVPEQIPGHAGSVHGPDHQEDHLFAQEDENLDGPCPLSSGEAQIHQHKTVAVPASNIVRENVSAVEEGSRGEIKLERDGETFSRTHKQENKKRDFGGSKNKILQESIGNRSHKRQRRFHISSTSPTKTSSINKSSSSYSYDSDSSYSSNLADRKKSVLLETKHAGSSRENSKFATNVSKNLVEVPAKKQRSSNNHCQTLLEKHDKLVENSRKYDSRYGVESQHLQGRISTVEFLEASLPFTHLKDKWRPHAKFVKSLTGHDSEAPHILVNDDYKNNGTSFREPQTEEVQKETSQTDILESHLRQQALTNLRRYQAMHEENTVREK